MIVVELPDKMVGIILLGIVRTQDDYANVLSAAGRFAWGVTLEEVGIRRGGEGGIVTSLGGG